MGLCASHHSLRCRNRLFLRQFCFVGLARRFSARHFLAPVRVFFGLPYLSDPFSVPTVRTILE